MPGFAVERGPCRQQFAAIAALTHPQHARNRAKVVPCAPSAGEFESAADECGHIVLAYSLNIMAEVVQRVREDAAGAFQLGERFPASVEPAGYCTIESVQLRLQIIEVHRWFRKAKDVFFIPS